MATEVIGTAEYRIGLDASGLEAGMKKAKATFSDGAGEMANKAETSTKSASKLSTVTTALISSVVTKAVDIGTSAISNFASGIWNTGVKFESTMSRVEAISGATGDSLAALTEKARELGENTRYSASEVAEGFTYMAMAGWDAGQMLDGIEGLLNLATVGELDLGTTSDIVTDQLTAFGMSADQTGQMADIMAQTISNSSTDISMMGESLKYAGSVAGSLGYSFDDVSVAIGLMASASIKGSMAGTSLRSIMTRLANDTSGCATILSDMGVEIINADGSMRDFGDVISDMRGLFAGLSEAEKTQLASTIAGTEGMAGLLAIVNASEEDFEKLTSAVNESSGAAASMANILSDNVQGNVDTLNSRMQALQEGAFNGLKPAINNAISGLADFGSALQVAFTGDGDFSVDELITSMVGKISTALQESLPMIGNAIGTVAPILIEAFAGIIPSLVKGFIKGIQQFVAAVAKALPDVLSAIKDAISGLVEALTDTETISMIIEGLVSIVETLSTELPGIIATLIDAIVDVLLNPETINLLIGAALQMLMSIVNAIPQVITALAGAIPTIINAITTTLTSGGSLMAIVNGAVTLFFAILDAIPQIVKALADALPDIIESIVGFLLSPETFGTLLEASITLFFAIVEAVPKIFASLLAAFGSLVGSLWDGLMKMLSDFAGNFGEFIGGVFKNALNGVLSFIEGFINAPIKLINNFIDLINGAFGFIGVNLGRIGTISLPRMYMGGIVPATGGGMPILAGDGGEDEFVVPESKMASLIDKIEEQGGVGGETFNFTFNGVLGTPSEMRELAVVFHDKYEEVKKSRFANDQVYANR